MKIKIPKRKCERCGHKWLLKKPTEPRVCPKCKSPYWDKPRQAKSIPSKPMQN